VNEHIIAGILGVVEGVTEFLPVSSTGHLILAGHLLGFHGQEAATFDVFIQLGAILAVVANYRHKFRDLASMGGGGGFSGRRGVLLLGCTTLPALALGYLAHGAIKDHLFNPATVAIGLAAGGLWVLLAEHFYAHEEPRTVDRLTWTMALGIGLFQCLAMWPGVSRSASTILGAMVMGLDRRSATEYSFFAAVPVMFAACTYDIVASWPVLRPEAIPYFTTGFVVAFGSAWLAVRLFIRFVSRHTLKPFGWYRLALALVVFLWLRG
jgi:undecaprenyl-diphosphatase